MTVKLTILFKHETNLTGAAPAGSRIGGWSESWYNAGTDIPATRLMAENGASGFPSILVTRAALLPSGSRIIGQRYQLVEPRGSSQQHGRIFPAPFAGVAADVPQMALLCTAPAIGVPNIRRLILRGLPDQYITEGEYNPTVGFTAALNQFFLSLSVWRMRGRNLQNANIPIFNVSTGGLFTTTAVHGFNANDRVRVSRTMQTSGAFADGVFMVTASGLTANTFTTSTWPFGATTGGTVRKEETIFPLVNAAAIAVARVITRRVGRPFGGYVGRRTRSRV